MRDQRTFRCNSIIAGMRELRDMPGLFRGDCALSSNVFTNLHLSQILIRNVLLFYALLKICRRFSNIEKLATIVHFLI